MAIQETDSTSFPLTREAFKNWLANRGHGVAGLAGNPCHCPIATCINERMPSFAYVGVRNTHILIVLADEHPRRERVDMPYWAKMFIVKVDNTHGNQYSVTASTALEILSEIPEAQI